jgi:hypothetical protein
MRPSEVGRHEGEAGAREKPKQENFEVSYGHFSIAFLPRIVVPKA